MLERYTALIKEIGATPGICMEFAHYAAGMSTCLRRHVGCVVVKDNTTLVVAANGPLKSEASCEDVGCARQEEALASGTRLDKCQAVHAEQSAIASCAKHDGSMEGSTVYLTVSPCDVCARLLVQAGVAEVVYDDIYPNSRGVEILTNAGVKATHFHKEK